MDSSFPLPTIHLNGTDKKVLLSQHSTALNYLGMAINAFEATTCHPRDYYVHADPQAWDKAVEVFDLEQEKKETPLCDKEVLIECIKSGSHFTSQLAKCLGKPVAATNSILNSLRKNGVLKVNKETEGLKWEIVSIERG